MMPYMDQENRFVEPQSGPTTKNKLSPAGAWLVRRRCVSNSLAELVAELAGFASAGSAVADSQGHAT